MSIQITAAVVDQVRVQPFVVSDHFSMTHPSLLLIPNSMVRWILLEPQTMLSKDCHLAMLGGDPNNAVIGLLPGNAVVGTPLANAIRHGW